MKHFVPIPLLLTTSIAIIMHTQAHAETVITDSTESGPTAVFEPVVIRV